MFIDLLAFVFVGKIYLAVLYNYINKSVLGKNVCTSALSRPILHEALIN